MKNRCWTGLELEHWMSSFIIGSYTLVFWLILSPVFCTDQLFSFIRPQHIVRSHEYSFCVPWYAFFLFSTTCMGSRWLAFNESPRTTVSAKNFFTVLLKKKVIYILDGLRVSKLIAKFHCWVNYPFKNFAYIIDSVQRMLMIYRLSITKKMPHIVFKQINKHYLLQLWIIFKFEGIHEKRSPKYSQVNTQKFTPSGMHTHTC